MKFVCGCIFLVGFSSVYAYNNFNPRTGIYYITANNFFYRPSNERGNEVIDRGNTSEFSDRISGSAINITDSLVFDAYTISTSLIAQGSMGDLKDTKFYTQ